MGTFNKTFELIHKGTNLNLPAWGLLPFFALPANGVTLIAGETQTIYGDTLINVPVVNNLTVTYTCSIGTQSGNNLVLTTPAAGTYPCVIDFKNKGLLIVSKTINLIVEAKATASTKKIMLIGDSLTVSGSGYYEDSIRAIHGNNITFVGTKGTTYKHEGISGFSFYQFLNNAGSPFVKAGALNIPAYFTDNSISVPDYIIIGLGVNDVFARCAVGSPLTDGDLGGFIGQATTLINAFLSYNHDIKIMLSLPTFSNGGDTAWNIDYDESVYIHDKHIENVHHFWKTFADYFAEGTFNANVTCSYEPLFLDRITGYGNAANSGLHPVGGGYTQLGHAMAFKLNSILNIDNAYYNALQAETKTYITGLTTKLSKAEINRIDKLVIDLKATTSSANLSDSFDDIVLFSSETTETSLKNLVKNATNPTLVNAPTFTKYEGITLNGINQYINSNYTPATPTEGITFTINSASIGIYKRSGSMLAGQYADGLSVLFQSAGGYCAMNSSSWWVATGGSDVNGLSILIRDSATTEKYYQNKVQYARTNTGRGFLTNAKILIGAYNPETPTGFTAGQVSILFVGKAFTQAQVNAITDAFELYMDTRGKGVV